MFFLPLDLRQPVARLESMIVTAGAAALVAPSDFTFDLGIPTWTVEAGNSSLWEAWFLCSGTIIAIIQ